MKKQFILLTFIFSCFSSAFSQERYKEVGLNLYNLDNFGIHYKFGDENKHYRISALSLSASYSDSNPNYDNKNFGFGIAAGIEYPKLIKDNLYFIYGFETSYNTNVQKQQYKQSHYRLGLSAILGITYKLNSTINIGAELLPGIRYIHYKDNGNKSDGISLGFNSQSAKLSLGIMF